MKNPRVVTATINEQPVLALLCDSEVGDEPFVCSAYRVFAGRGGGLRIYPIPRTDPEFYEVCESITADAQPLRLFRNHQ